MRVGPSHRKGDPAAGEQRKNLVQHVRTCGINVGDRFRIQYERSDWRGILPKEPLDFFHEQVGVGEVQRRPEAVDDDSGFIGRGNRFRGRKVTAVRGFAQDPGAGPGRSPNDIEADGDGN